MEAHVPFRGRAFQYEALEVRIGLSSIGERGVVQETEAAVVVRASQENAPGGSPAAQEIQAPGDQGAADTSSLQPGRDRNRPKPVPGARLVIDTNGGEGDVANHSAGRTDRDKGDAQGLRRAQVVDDPGLVAVAERHRRKRRGGESADFTRVAGTLGFDAQTLSVVRGGRVQQD